MNNNVSNGNNKSITGQPPPLAEQFKLLRKRALGKPFLNADWTANDVNVNYHGLIINYSSSYILAAIVLVFYHENKFKWFIQTQFVGKKTQKNLSLMLMTAKQKKVILKMSELALDGCGKSHTRNKTAKKDCEIWTFELTNDELEQIKPEFREYAAKEAEKGETNNEAD